MKEGNDSPWGHTFSESGGKPEEVFNLMLQMFCMTEDPDGLTQLEFIDYGLLWQNVGLSHITACYQCVAPASLMNILYLTNQVTVN